MNGLSVFLLSTFPVVSLFLLTRANVRFGVVWIWSALMASIAQVITIRMLWNLPLQTQWAAWASITGTSKDAVWFLVDEVSWPIATGLLAVLVALHFVLLARSDEVSGRTLLLLQLFAALGVAAAFAGSIPALLIVWTVLDITGLYLGVREIVNDEEVTSPIANFAGRVFGSFTILIGASVAASGSTDLLLVADRAPAWVALGAAIRFGLTPVPAQPKSGRERPTASTAMHRLASLAGVLVLTIRVAYHGGVAASPLRTAAIAWLVLTGLLSAWNWLVLSIDRSREAHWFTAIGSITMVTGIYGLSRSTLVLSVILILCGGLLLLRQSPVPGEKWILGLCGVMLVGLAYSPTWGAAGFVSAAVRTWGLVGGLVLAALAAGFFHPRLEAGWDGRAVYGGYRVAELLGLLIPPAVLVFTGLAPLATGGSLSGGWWEGLAVLVVAMGLRAGIAGGVQFREIGLDLLPAWLHPRSISRWMWSTFLQVGRVVGFFLRILEGESAVLWAILLLGLLISLFAQLGLGQ